MNDLREAVKRWISAEFGFRLGPNAYQTPATDAFVEAEANLRKALTGQGDLGAAAGVVLGFTAPKVRYEFPKSYRKARARKAADLQD